jgi:predicted nucleic acid-binding protein
MIFVDTGIWYAANVPEDADHQAARDLLLSAASDLVTTDYVIDELLTLLVVRGHRAIAKRIGDQFWTLQACDLVWTQQTDVADAWNVFVTFNDKTWSFTDCVSYAVMKRLGIVEAFALDDDFKQFGFFSVKP